MARAKVVQTAHQAELLKQPGVQAVGISSSVDSPGEAALLIYLIRGVEHGAIPHVIDSLRTRVREGNRFRADYGGAHPKRGCSVPAAKTATQSERLPNAKTVALRLGAGPKIATSIFLILSFRLLRA